MEQLLAGRELVDRHDLPVAHHHVGLAAQDRPHQLRDVGGLVLVVGVGVDDHVGAQLQPGVETGLEGGGQPLVVGQADDVVDAVLTRRLHGPVAGAVVDDQPLDRVEARDLAGKAAERQRELPFFVEARDLDDELHGGGAGLWAETSEPARRSAPRRPRSGQR